MHAFLFHLPELHIKFVAKATVYYHKNSKWTSQIVRFLLAFFSCTDKGFAARTCTLFEAGLRIRLLPTFWDKMFYMDGHPSPLVPLITQIWISKLEPHFPMLGCFLEVSVIPRGGSSLALPISQDGEG